MAADSEVRLISKVVRDRDLMPLLDAGVQDDWWGNPDVKAVWRWLVGHWSKYGEVATAATVKSEFPVFTLLAVDDSLEYLTDKFVEYRRSVKITDMFQDGAELLSSTNDHEAALMLAEQQIADIHLSGTPGVTDLILTNDPMARLTAYDAAAARGGGLLGIPTGFDKIDEATSGLQDGQLITVIANPKVGKSQLCMAMGIYAHSANHDILFQSFEMSNHEQQIRHDSMRAHVSHARMLRSILTSAEKAEYVKMLKEQAKAVKQFRLSDSMHGITVSALTAQIEKSKPRIVFVDGVYLMIDEQTGEQNTPQALTNITRSLKRLAQRRGLPIVISTQTLPWKGKGSKSMADAIGYSSSFLQDSDAILGLQRVDNNDEARELQIVEARNCGQESVTLVWRWDTGCFHEYGQSATCPGCITARRFAPTVPGMNTP